MALQMSIYTLEGEKVVLHMFFSRIQTLLLVLCYCLCLFGWFAQNGMMDCKYETEEYIGANMFQR